MRILSSTIDQPKKENRPSAAMIRKKVEENKVAKIATDEKAYSSGVRSAIPFSTPGEELPVMNSEKLKDALRNNSFNFSAKEREVLDQILQK